MKRTPTKAKKQTINKILTIIILVVILTSCQRQKQSSNIVTTDIAIFWEAYDNITSTKDSVLQYKYLDSLYFQKGSAGLEGIKQAKNYTARDYINAINSYPKFWKSIRENTLQVDKVGTELDYGIDKFKAIYPELKPAKIYFTMGALRSGGTTIDSMVLIGSEISFADSTTVTSEFPEILSHLNPHFATNPNRHLGFLNIHEYVHTQQKTTIGNSLLAQTVLEGVAEFVAEKALETRSPNPQIEFGRNNDAKIKAKFELEMFSPNLYNWIWNSPDNEFGMRDLAYYVGYKICEDYYNISQDKQQAIKEMIELDYSNENELIKFVEKSAYFDKPLKSYKEAYEKSRPKVKSVDRIENKINDDVLTIHFSQKMDTRFRNFQLGPLGEENVIRIKDFKGFSEDGKSVSFGIEKLEPSKKYQIVVGPGFRNTNGIPLIPYLIEFKTTE